MPFKIFKAEVKAEGFFKATFHEITYQLTYNLNPDWRSLRSVLDNNATRQAGIWLVATPVLASVTRQLPDTVLVFGVSFEASLLDGLI